MSFVIQEAIPLSLSQSTLVRGRPILCAITLSPMARSEAFLLGIIEKAQNFVKISQARIIWTVCAPLFARVALASAWTFTLTEGTRSIWMEQSFDLRFDTLSGWTLPGNF